MVNPMLPLHQSSTSSPRSHPPSSPRSRLLSFLSSPWVGMVYLTLIFLGVRHLLASGATTTNTTTITIIEKPPPHHHQVVNNNFVVSPGNLMNPTHVAIDDDLITQEAKRDSDPQATLSSLAGGVVTNMVKAMKGEEQFWSSSEDYEDDLVDPST